MAVKEKIKRLCSRVLDLNQKEEEQARNCMFALLVAGLVYVLASCSSHHYFSINAEEITNPSIMYSDSTNLTNPF